MTQFTPTDTPSGIYGIFNLTNGDCYIGSAVNWRVRFRNHLSALRRGIHHNNHLLNAWSAYGEDAFSWVVLEIVDNKVDLVAREQHWIDFLHPRYNINMEAGSCLGKKLEESTKAKISQALKGHPHSAETRAKIAATLKGRKPPLKAVENAAAANRGKKRSAEVIERCIAPLRGKPLSEEHRAKLSDVRKGKVPSQFTRDKQSVALKGRQRTPEHCAKLSEAKKGCSISEGHRAALKVAQQKRYSAPGVYSPMKGRTFSEESKAKMSASAKARHARKTA